MKHLNALHSPEHHNGKQMVELFEKGYGKDAASIANDAINYGELKKIQAWKTAHRGSSLGVCVI